MTAPADTNPLREALERRAAQFSLSWGASGAHAEIMAAFAAKEIAALASEPVAGTGASWPKEEIEPGRFVDVDPAVLGRDVIARIIDPAAFNERYVADYPDRSTVEQFTAYQKADAILEHRPAVPPQGRAAPPLSEFQRRLDASVTPSQARVAVRREREALANRDKPHPQPDGFINDYD